MKTNTISRIVLAALLILSIAVLILELFGVNCGDARAFSYGVLINVAFCDLKRVIDNDN